jgi:hypothetical protein
MDSPRTFSVTPLPLEIEFRAQSVGKRLKELSRSELEEFLADSILLLSRLSHQTRQLRDFLEELEVDVEG